MQREDEALEDLVRRAAEIALAAEAATFYGECLRLGVLLDEARSAYWTRSGRDHDAQQAIWSSRFCDAHRTVANRSHELRRLRPVGPIEFELAGPTRETFFDFRGETERPLGGDRSERRLDQIEAAERRLGVPVAGLLREVFAHGNGGYTDFVHHPLTPWTRHRYPWTPRNTFDDYFAEWEEVIPDRLIVSVQHWKSLETYMADYLAPPEDVSDDDWSETQESRNKVWRTSLPGLDRLVVVSVELRHRSMEQNMLCLDWRHGLRPGVAIVTDNGSFGGELTQTHGWPSFDTFFGRLRRFASKEVDGLVRRRGHRIVEILDEGRWRVPG